MKSIFKSRVAKVFAAYFLFVFLVFVYCDQPAEHSFMVAIALASVMTFLVEGLSTMIPPEEKKEDSNGGR